MVYILEMYITLLPVILAGILNMAWCKAPVFDFLKTPLDHNRTFMDGRRLLGDNKTYKGLAGMLAFGVACTILWGAVCGSSDYLQGHNYLYRSHDNTLLYNGVIGFFLGLAYALFELPNSFIKRRFAVPSGKTVGGPGRYFFIFFDQADSIIGCTLAVCFVYPMSPAFYLAYVLVGAATHIILNMLLYFARLRGNMF